MSASLPPVDPRPHLVVGDDRSPGADDAWGWVTDQPWPGWLVSAVTARPPVGVAPERATPRAWQPDTPRLAPPGAEVEHLVADTDPRLLLDSFHDATALVVGPRGAGALKRMHLGSTAEWLVSGRRPLIPTIVVRSPRPVREVVVCTDGSGHALAAAQTLADLPLVTRTRATVLGLHTAHGRADEGVAQVAGLLRAAGADVVPRAEDASHLDVRAVLLGVVEELAADLVVVGTRGVGGIRRLLLGSTASAVVHHAPCTVLVGRALDG